MKLLKELNLMEGKRGRRSTKQLLSKVDKSEIDKANTGANNNLVAKNMRAAGNRSTAHADKVGNKASRTRQKRVWKKDADY